MPLSSQFTLNPLPASVQWNESAFTVKVAGSVFHSTPSNAVFAAVSGDLTGDGWPEIVSTGWTFNGANATGTPPSVPLLVVSTSSKGAKLLDPVSLLGRAASPGAQAIHVADFNNDGRLDLIIAGYNESPYTNTRSTLYLNKGNGAFTPLDLPVDGALHNGEVSDLNGDGKLDFLASGYTVARAFDARLYTSPSYQSLDGHQGIVAFLGDGKGGFKALPFSYNMSLADVAAGQAGRLNWGLSSDVTSADLDGDGKSEIIAVDLLNSADTSPTVGNSWIFTNIRSDATSIWGDPVALPKPYFEGNAKYDDLKSSLPSQRSHDVAVNVLDFDNDGDLDLIVSSLLWDQTGYGASMLQFLRNDGKLKFTDVTDTTIYNSYIARSDPGHTLRIVDVNNDGFKDIVVAEPGTYVANGTLDKSWSNEIYLNTGNGKFVSVMWDQFHDIAKNLAEVAKASGFNQYFPGAIEPEFNHYITPDGRLGFVASANGYANSSGAYTEVVFTVEANVAMSTGPGGKNPALQGAPGFSEVYYLTEHPDVAAAVKAGSYASGLAHWLAVGKAAGFAGFAKGATVRGSDGKDTIALREGNETAYGLGGNDTLKGGAGNDTLIGGAGNDVLLGGVGIDTASYADAASRVAVSLALGSAQNTLGGGIDTVSGIENLTGSAFGDALTGSALGNILAGAAGNDVLRGGGGNDRLDGGDGIDQLYGEAGRDVLLGGAGNDRLTGGGGADTLTGGLGRDVFAFDSAPLAGERDTIADFSRLQSDKVWLSKAAFSGLGALGALAAGAFHAAAGATAAHDADDRIVYDTATGIAWYDTDGAGGAAAVAFAQFGAGSTHPAMAAGDFLIVA